MSSGHHGTGFGDGGTAAEQVVGVGVLRGDGAIDGVGHAGEKVARRLIIPFCGRAVGIGESGLQVRTGKIRPRKIAHRGEAAGGGVIGDGLLTVAIHGVAHRPPVGVPMAGESLGVKTVHLLGGELPEGIIREGCGADGIGGGGLAAHRVVGVGEAGAVGKRHGGLAAAGTTPDGYRYAVHEVGFFGEVSLKGIFMREFIQLSACLY